MNNTRGVKQLHKYGNDSLSITDLLEKPEIVNYLEQGNDLAYPSLRERLRRRLKKFGDNLKGMVDQYSLENPVDQERQQRQRDTLYGAQLRRPLPRNPRGLLLVTGERLTARQALEKYPQLKEILQPNGNILERSLHAKYRAWLKKGKITREMLGPPFEVLRVGSNAKFTTYFDSYTIKVNRYPVEPLDVFRRAIDTTISERGLVTGDKIRLIVSHPAWAKPFSTKLLTITDDENFIYALVKAVLEFVE